MARLELIDATRLRSVLTMAAAIDALDEAFSAERLPEAPPRQHHDVGSGELLLMPSWGEAGMGVKLVTVAAGNAARGLPLVQGVYVLFEPDGLTPVALIDGAALTSIRTAAVSGLVTRYLASPEAENLVIFGAGTQARSHMEAMREVRDIRQVTIVSRTKASAEALAAEVVGVKTSVGTADAISEADIVCTCTTSSDPLFDGRDLAPGSHVNAVGAFKPDARELDSATMARAKVVVETREAALAEAGDIVLAIAEGAMTSEDIVADIQEIAHGARPRTSETDITVFKSVGAAFEDLVIAGACVRALA